MNERIRELLAKTLQESKPTAWEDIGNEKLIELLEPFQEKFAELIVRECCDLIREIDAMEIRKHFGVE